MYSQSVGREGLQNAPPFLGVFVRPLYVQAEGMIGSRSRERIGESRRPYVSGM